MPDVFEARYTAADPVRNPFTWEAIDFPLGEWVEIPNEIAGRAEAVPWLKVRKKKDEPEPEPVEKP